MRNIVLFSGGMDSTVALGLACWRDGVADTTALVLSYGQAHINELSFAREITSLWGVTSVSAIVDPSPWKLLPLCRGTTQQDRDTYAMRTGGISDAFLPGRNVAFLGVALAICGITGADTVWIGANADDATGFPDCRAPFLHAWQQMASHALARPIHLMAPFVEQSKRQIVALGHAMAIDFSRTWSCYRPHRRRDLMGVEPCGRCDACVLRNEALNGTD